MNKKAIYIEVSNDGNNLDKCCNSTLTVGELIDILKTYDLDRPICLRHSDAYGDDCAYGMITHTDVNAAEDIYADDDDTPLDAETISIALAVAMASRGVDEAETEKLNKKGRG